MKKLKKLKLDQLSKVELVKKEMYNLSGGHCGGGHTSCGCACYYEGTPGGSSTWDNLSANLNGGIVSSTYGPH